MLEVKNVSKQYKGEDKLLFDAVSDVSLSMEDHCIYALVGESGCGKSTLSRLILGAGISFIRSNPAGRKTDFPQRKKKPERNGKSDPTGIAGRKKRS